MRDPLSPAERRMLQVLDRSWLIPGVVKNAVRREYAQGNPGLALGFLALWQVAFYGATTALVLAMMRL